ncbi:MAG: hypothetical protein WBD71_11585 [Xanthobacteraceae bacterium]
MERNAEIEQINRELAALRDRYAAYSRLARLWKVFFLTLAGVLAIGAVVLIVKAFLIDWLYGLFSVGAVLLFVVTTIWFIRTAGLRWIDVATPFLMGIYSPRFFYPDQDQPPKPRSRAEDTEQQIAARELRLRELGENTVVGQG